MLDWALVQLLKDIMLLIILKYMGLIYLTLF